MKLTPEEWEELIRKALAEQKAKKSPVPEHRIEINEVLAKIRTYVPVSIVIGGVAIVLFHHYFGSQLLFRKILEWTIAGTIFATILAALGRQKKG